MKAEHARARYAGQLAWRTTRLVMAIRDGGPDATLAEIRSVLATPAPDGMDPVIALITILAAQIPPDSRPDQTLDWVRDFTGVPPQLDPSAPHPSDVERVIAGDAPSSGIPMAAQREAVRYLSSRHLTVDEIAARTGMLERTVQRHRAALRAEAMSEAAS